MLVHIMATWKLKHDVVLAIVTMISKMMCTMFSNLIDNQIFQNSYVETIKYI
jgi:hypothetical protein